jgi:NTE family protein
MNRRSLLLVTSALVVLGGCAHHPINAPLLTQEPNSGYRFNTLAQANNSDSLLIILAFSGGGTRAAALSYGVLAELARTEIVWEGERRRLLDEVDIISSVSGGSFTAAYYGLYGERIFTEFEPRFLKRNVQSHLLWRYFSPLNWFRLASGSFDRSDLAAEYYDRHVFGRQTFGDLLRRGQRPLVIINATDMSANARFEFTQNQFDLIGSDLSSFPVARAVAASSAYPVLLSPITLLNHAGRFRHVEPDWMSPTRTSATAASRRQAARVAELRSYQDAARRPYLHLLDGGLADNLGLRSVLDAVYSMEDAWSAMRTYRLEKMSKVVVIVVNAEASRDRGWDLEETAPSWVEVMRAVGTVGVSRYSIETMELLRISIEKWQQEIETRRAAEYLAQTSGGPGNTPPPAKLRFYPIEAGFDTLADPSERSYYKGIATTMNLPASTVDKLRELGGQLLRESTTYQELLRDLRSASPP